MPSARESTKQDRALEKLIYVSEFAEMNTQVRSHAIACHGRLVSGSSARADKPPMAPVCMYPHFFNVPVFIGDLAHWKRALRVFRQIANGEGSGLTHKPRVEPVGVVPLIGSVGEIYHQVDPIGVRDID